MDTLSPDILVSMVLAAPGWVRVGIATTSEQMKDAAALELGISSAERNEESMPTAVEGQVAPPL